MMRGPRGFDHAGRRNRPERRIGLVLGGKAGLYGGNVSAVIAELAADAALLEGMHELVPCASSASVDAHGRC
jgi:hypothetical protein